GPDHHNRCKRDLSRSVARHPRPNLDAGDCALGGAEVKRMSESAAGFRLCYGPAPRQAAPSTDNIAFYHSRRIRDGSLCSEAAVDGQGHASHETGFVASEEDNAGRHLVGRAHSAHWCQSEGASHALGLEPPHHFKI